MKVSPVRVFTRIRPSTSTDNIYLECSSPDTCVLTNPRNSNHRISYKYDGVFNFNDSQECIFENLKPFINNVFSGRNVTIFAYGQSGSGKTHTINGNSNDPGIIPQTMNFLLNSSSSISVAYIEIYNEKIIDLLNMNNSNSNGLDIRENSDKSINISGLSNVELTSIHQFNILHQGALKLRTTAATQLNEFSSRSHFIMQITITTSNTSLDSDKQSDFISKLNLIDLAGSEDNKRTGNVGARMTESGAINKSLFVLGQVVEALNKSLPRIPYRDSKITRLLSDSLGGNAIGIMIACCSPDEQDYTDTFNTLNFALKSSLVKNVTVVNQMPKKEKIESDRSLQLQNWKNSRNKLSNNHQENKLQVEDLNNLTSDLSKKQKSDQDSEFNKRMNAQIETRVNQKLEELKAGILRSATITSSLKEADNLRQQGNFSESISKLKLIMPLVPTTKTKEFSRIQTMLNELEIQNEVQSKFKECNISDVENLVKKTEERIIDLLNHGTLKELKRLNTIGDKRAQMIIESRKAHRIFKNMDDLLEIGFSRGQTTAFLKSNLNIF